MSLHFRSIFHGYDFNVGFFFKDGPNLGNLSTFHKGDTVVLFWDIAEKQFHAINENIHPSKGLRAYKDISTSQVRPTRYYVVIPFQVIERRRALFSRDNDSLSLHDGGYTITLQAENGYWEDVFKWVVMQEKPVWADEESDEQEK